MESTNMLSYLRLKVLINRSSGRHRNNSQQRLYEFCYLLPFDLWMIWLGVFFYKNVATGFGNFLVLQGCLTGNNIVSMCDIDSILMWNPYGVWKQLLYSYYSRNLSLNKFPSQLIILCTQGNY
jgi:hypothetical protein